MEILPVQQSTFSSGQNAQIAFQISSNSDILCGSESYFRFDFRNSSATTYVPATAGAEPYVAFDVGGIHALFKSIEIRSLGSGITLQRYDDYNCWNAIASLVYDTDEDVMRNAVSGDDFNHNERTARSVPVATSIAVTAATGVVTGDGTNFLQHRLVGRTIVISYATGLTVTGKVLSVASDTSLTLSPGCCHTNIAAAAAKINVLPDEPFPQAQLQNWRRWFHSYISATGTHVVIFKPRLSILQHNLPLFLMKGGIEIIFELADGGRGIQVAENVTMANAALALSYEITRPRFFAQMITPHPDIIDEYIRQWKSPTGLVYSIPSVRSRRVSGSTVEASPALNYTVGVRSARRAFLVVRPDLFQGSAISPISNKAPSISAFPRTGIRYFQAKIGSHEYPNRAVQTISGNESQATEFSEAWENLMMVTGKRSNRRLKMHHHFSTYGPHNYLTYTNGEAAYGVNDSRHFIMAFDFSRDKGLNGDLTGADLSIVPLAIDLSREAAAIANAGTAASFGGGAAGTASTVSTFTYHLFVEHDSFLKISSEQMSVMN